MTVPEGTPEVPEEPVVLEDLAEEGEYDLRPPGGYAEDESGNPNVLAEVDEFLEDGGALQRIRDHIPLEFVLLGVKIADETNRRTRVHAFGPGIPFRYVSNLTQLGASGTGKGMTVEQFYRIVGPVGREPAIFPCDTYRGGSLEALRGGITTIGTERVVEFGQIQENPGGFVYVDEGTQLADMAGTRGGVIQAIIAWADSNVMKYRTVSGGSVEYLSVPSLMIALQTARMTEVEAVVLGWHRRSVYDLYTAPLTKEILPANRPRPGDLNIGKLGTLRDSIRRVVTSWDPSEIVWDGFDEWLTNAYETNLAVVQDEQFLYSLGIGHHIITGGRSSGTVSIEVGEPLDRILRRILRYKRMARVALERRIAIEITAALRDENLLGKYGSRIEGRLIRRWLAARLSISEDLVGETLPVLTENGTLDATTSKDGNGKTLYSLVRR